LDQELEEAEEHHVPAHQGHARCMDTLMQLHAVRMTFIQQQFETNVRVGSCPLPSNMIVHLRLW
jgi:hypothetical protein